MYGEGSDARVVDIHTHIHTFRSVFSFDILGYT